MIAENDEKLKLLSKNFQQEAGKHIMKKCIIFRSRKA